MESCTGPLADGPSDVRGAGTLVAWGPWKLVAIVSKLVCNLLTRPTSNLYTVGVIDGCDL